MELNVIDRTVYIKFIVDNFAKFRRKIKDENAGLIYDIFKGYTFYIQKACNEAFSDTAESEECTEEIIRSNIDSMIALYDTFFREMLSQIPERQKEVLYAIAKEGEAKCILSGEFIKKYSLSTPSSVQAAVKKLIERELITDSSKIYTISDKLFWMWIKREYGG